MPIYGWKSINTVAVNATADGNNTVVAAPGANKKIVVLGYQLRMVGAVGGEAITVRSGTAGTIHLSELAAATPGARIAYAGDNEGPAFVCDENALLNINTAAGGDVLGHLTYVVRSMNY
jgi:hypothetical protein